MGRTIEAFVVPPSGVNWQRFQEYQNFQQDQGEDLLGDLADSFLRHAPLQIEKLNEFFHQRDFLMVRKQAHSMKSGFRSLGAERLGFFCQNLERVAWESANAKLEEGMEELRVEFAITFAQFSQFSLLPVNERSDFFKRNSR